MFLKYHKNGVVISSDTDPVAGSQADTDEDLMTIKNYLRTEFDVELESDGSSSEDDGFKNPPVPKSAQKLVDEEPKAEVMSLKDRLKKAQEEVDRTKKRKPPAPKVDDIKETVRAQKNDQFGNMYMDEID